MPETDVFLVDKIHKKSTDLIKSIDFHVKSMDFNEKHAYLLSNERPLAESLTSYILIHNIDI